MSSESLPDPPVDHRFAQRLLQAATPAMSAELSRILEEFRERFEAEAKVRLQKALLDREADFKTQSEGLRNRVRAETTTAVTNQVTAQLEERFKGKLAEELQALEERLRKNAERTRSELQDQADQSRSEWKRNRTELLDQVDRWRARAEFHRRVGEASSQLEILRRFLRAAERFSGGVALYLNKPDGLALWNSEGDAAPFPEVISDETKDPEWFWAPIVVRSKMIAVVCAAEVADPEPLTVLIDGLRRAVEYHGLRMQVLGSGQPLETSPGSGPEAASSRSQAAGGDARRLARTLVSGIKLGHEQDVMEGRARFDLYARLQRQIDEGRKAYLRQLPSPAPSQDFFHDELVKILADNDPGRLGQGYPGPS